MGSAGDRSLGRDFAGSFPLRAQGGGGGVEPDVSLSVEP